MAPLKYFDAALRLGGRGGYITQRNWHQLWQSAIAKKLFCLSFLRRLDGLVEIVRFIIVVHFIVVVFVVVVFFGIFCLPGLWVFLLILQIQII